MSDNVYCYPDSNVLKNKCGLEDAELLHQAETELVAIRLLELQLNPIAGKYDLKHLQAIHRYLFQDLYDWAGKIRTVEIGKGNMFCLSRYIPEYADSVFRKFLPECQNAKNDFKEFVCTFAKNYGNLNALHPFREGNGRTQREFARLVCLACGYDLDFSHTNHKAMLEASIASFNYGDNTAFEKIFAKGISIML